MAKDTPKAAAPAKKPEIPGGPQTTDPSTRSVDTEAIEAAKPLSEAVEADQAAAEASAKPSTNPSHFVETYGEHEETGKEQALRHAGDGTLSVWPPQPDPQAGPQTIDADGKVTVDKA